MSSTAATDGAVEARDLSPLAYWLAADLPGHERWASDVAIRPGAVVDLGEIHLKKKRRPIDPRALAMRSKSVRRLLRRLGGKGNGGAANDLLRAVADRIDDIQQLPSQRDRCVIVGQVRVDGPDDPCAVMAPALVDDDGYYADGYFATTVAPAGKPLSFFLHGYEPALIHPRCLGGGAIIRGEATLKPTPPERRGSLQARLILEGDAERNAVRLQVISPSGFMMDSAWGPDNPARGGAAPCRVPQPSVSLSADGTVEARDLSPINYVLSAELPGYLSFSNGVTIKPGAVEDVGEIRLVKQRKIALRFFVSEFPTFDAVAPSTAEVMGETHWSAVAGAGSDLEFSQDNDRVMLLLNGGYIADLGRGRVEDFRAPPVEALSFQVPPWMPLAWGHVYLLRPGRRHHWLLVSAEEVH